MFFFFEDIQFTAFPTDQICSCSTLLFPGVAVGINLLAPVSNLPNHIPVNNREMFLLTIPSDRNLKIHILSNAFFNPSLHFFMFDLYLFDFLPISRSRNSKAALPSQWRPLLASISFRYYHPTFPPLIYSQFNIVWNGSSCVFLLCLFCCFVCGQRFQIPHRGPESRCLVQWLRRQSCKEYLSFGKISKIRKTLRASHSQPSITSEI